jgi:putative nucleotidyltransferase with HDIG domain
MMMPEMDGEALLASTKERFPDMPVVMVTAMHDISIALSAIRNGAYDYLLKPFDREQLLATVRRALETRRLKMENRAYQTNLEALVTARTEQLRQAVTTLEKSYDITLEVLGDALDLKDAETENHSKRVTAYTIAIARAMGLSADQIRVIARGAFLHDIGKMAIPDAILHKPGKLDPDEIATMREHCYRGYQILRRIPFLSEAAEIVYAHQEKYDGSGYPRGLKGDQIPLGARIFSVADTFDAITSDRPYRPRQSYAAAREEIKRWSERQFDPEVVRIFLEMPEHIWDDLRKGIDEQGHRLAAYSGGKA